MPINRSTRCWGNSAVLHGINIFISVGLFFLLLFYFIPQELALKKNELHLVPPVRNVPSTQLHRFGCLKTYKKLSSRNLQCFSIHL